MSAVNFAAEIEREKARLRVTDTMMRHARAGHVTGGRSFGYDNVDVLGVEGNFAVLKVGKDPYASLRELLTDVARFQLLAAEP